MEREEVIEIVREETKKIIREELRALNFENLFWILNQEHDLTNGTHKQVIGKYVNYKDIKGTP